MKRGIWAIRMNQSLYTIQQAQQQRSGTKIKRNQMRKAHLQPQTVTNNEKQPYLSFGNSISQDSGVWLGMKNKGN